MYETPQQYIDALSQRIPLGDLYQVKDCYCDNAANEYCAVTVEVKDPNIRKILGIKEDDRILKVFNKSGDLVYQRTVAPIDKEHIKKATNRKFAKIKEAYANNKPMDLERGKYPLIALFQNMLIFDPREQVPTGNEFESEQSILNVVRLDHRKGTKIIKLRF